MTASEAAFWTYVLENPDGRRYVGSTNGLSRRLEEHNCPEHNPRKFTTRNRGPWRLVHLHREAELESLEHHALTEAEVAETVRQTARFAASLGSNVGQGPLAQRQAAMRRCVKRIVIDAEDRRLRIDLHVLPVGPRARPRQSRLPSSAAQKTGQPALQES